MCKRNRARCTSAPHWTAALVTSIAGVLSPWATQDASAQLHGGGVQKACDQNLCRGDNLKCVIAAVYLDGFNDVLMLSDAFDIIHANPIDVQVNPTIFAVLGNAACSGPGNDTLPCFIGAGGIDYTTEGFPQLDGTEPADGFILFLSDDYQIDQNDPDPLFDDGHLVFEDQCNMVTTGCNPNPQDLEFGAATNIISPSIHLEKDGSPEGGSLCVGVEGTINYTFTVTNTGDVVLSNVVVSDSECTPVFQSGDTNTNDILNFGEVWVYTCSVNVTPLDTDPIVNTAEVTADAPLSSGIPQKPPEETCSVSDEDSATVVPNDNPTLNVTRRDIDLCIGENDVFTATVSGGRPPYLVQWEDPNGDPIGKPCIVGDTEGALFECDLPVDSSFKEGNYCAVATDDNGCRSNEDCGNLEINPAKVVTVVRRETSVCEGKDEVTFTATVTGGRAPYHVVWTRQDDVESPAILFECFEVPEGGQCVLTLLNVDETDEGTYCATATDANKCVGEDCGELIVNPNRIVTVEPESQEACVGEDVTIDASAAGGRAPYAIEWRKTGSAAVIFDCDDLDENEPCSLLLQDVEVADAGTYCASVVDDNGCVDEACGTLTVFPADPCSIDNDGPFCPGSTNTHCGPPGQATYLWSFLENTAGASFVGPTDQQCVSVAVTQSGSYRLKLVTTTQDGCIRECEKLVSVVPAEPCEFFCIDDTCVGDTEEICGPDGYDSYDWSVEGPCEIESGEFEQCVNIHFSAPGTCFVELFVTTQEGCDAECSNFITVFPNRECFIDGPDKGCRGDSKLYCGPPGLASYTWFTTGQCVVEGSPNLQCAVITYTGNGNCEVSLHVNGTGGCGDECSLDVQVCPCPVCVEIDRPQYDPPCGSSGNLLTADVLDLSSTSVMHWTVTYGPCLITDGEDEQTVTYTIGSDPEHEVSCGFKFTVGQPESCAPVSKCHIDITCMPEICGEGCAVGYWKKSKHFGFWPEDFFADESCGEPTLFCDEFSCSTIAAQQAFGGKTLLDVLFQPGNGLKALGRQAVAALLNATSDDVEFALSEGHVKDMVNDAIDSDDLATYVFVKNQLAPLNQQYCPIVGESFCADLDFSGSVDHGDFNILMDNWGQPGAGDLDSNGIVGPRDLVILLSCWGTP